MIAEVFFWPIYFLYFILEMIGLELESLLLQNSLQVISFLQIISADLIQYSILIFLVTAIGMLIGLSLGLIGGGGSILAVPLLVYVIGLEPHVAIGTSAFVVGINALISFIDHKKKGHVLLNKGLLFAIPGVVGTLIGSYLGLLTPASSLLILFALFMISIAIKLLIQKKDKKRDKDIIYDHLQEITKDKEADQKTRDQLNTETDSGTNNRYKHFKVAIIGTMVGLVAGYFGIGGGFLIVPSLMYLNINIVNSIGTSLLPVSFFGLTTAASYSLSGQINFLIAVLLICGGIVGGKVGMALSSKASKTLLTKIFSVLLITVAIYIIIKTVMW
jgi:uncharacterized protein